MIDKIFSKKQEQQCSSLSLDISGWNVERAMDENGMKYKVLHHDPKNLVDYAKWLNHQFEENGLELFAVNGFYHIFTARDKKEGEKKMKECPYCKKASTDDSPPLERLRAFVRKYSPRCCKMLSVGPDCECPLCDLDRLESAINKEAGMKLRRNLDTLENHKFWSNVDKTQQNVESWPEWKRKVMLRKPAMDKGRPE
jgi:hypothetical protein